MGKTEGKLLSEEAGCRRGENERAEMGTSNKSFINAGDQ